MIEMRGRDVLVEVGAPSASLLGRSPRMAMDVACALPKKPRTDWLFEHGTEAGIRSFRPILTERTSGSSCSVAVPRALVCRTLRGCVHR